MNFKKGIYYLPLLLLIVVSNKVSYAQTDSLEIHNIKGKEYYIHIIQKGESLYFMHKKYNVPLEVIKKENPSVADGLSIGEKIFIPVKRDVAYQAKTDGNFINHTVKKKQTLYSIAKLYAVKQKEIIAANPELIDGLKEDQVIKIPVLNIKNEDFPKPVKVLSNYRTHTVVKGETLYSLSKLYNTTADSIKKVNDGLKQGVKTGEIIYIPLEKVIIPSLLTTNLDTSEVLTVGEAVQQYFPDTGFVVKKTEYQIGLLLPFYLDENDELTEHRSALEKKYIYRKSKWAIEFYNGFKMALDSLATDSCTFKLYVYDTKGNDSLRTQKLLLKPEMLSHDFIVGPLFSNNFKIVAKFASENRIPIVSPVKQSNKLLLGNPYVFKAIPSKSTTIKQVCSLVVDSFKTENLLAIEYENAKEKTLVDLFIKTYNSQLLNSEDTTIYSPIKVLKVNTNIADVVASLQLGKNNVIFVPASDQTFITNLFNLLTTTLNKKTYQDCKVTLIGLEEWMNYENIDLEYFQKLNVHFCTTKFINYQDSLTAQFVKGYVQKMNTYPSKNTFLGFDIGYYFGDNFIRQGTLSSPEALMPYKGMSINLNFFKTGIESGFENKNSFLLRFDDYTLKRIH